MKTVMKWYNEPASWSREGNTIRIRAEAKTDFWRKTHDGAVRDNGHFYFQTTGGSFTAEVQITGHYHALFDQAGLMLRGDVSHWLKCGIEYLDGMQQASVVCTREWSDWSVMALADPSRVWIRLQYRAPTVEVHYSLDGQSYTLIRQAYLPELPQMQAGLMIASPTGEGFEAVFEGFDLSE
jgi:regulation of enolase protein 1 (concanavalin A-like superfamily)